MSKLLGKWQKVAGYQELQLLEAFDMEELEMAEEALQGITRRCEDNEVPLDERWLQTLTDFLQKAKQRIISSQEGEQGDYEHRNQVQPSEITSTPVGGASDKVQTQQNLNNNGDSNVSV